MHPFGLKAWVWAPAMEGRACISTPARIQRGRYSFSRLSTVDSTNRIRALFFRESILRRALLGVSKMRAVVQRVSRACVVAGAETIGKIGPGLVVLVAVGQNDDAAAACSMAEKIVNLRIFNDDQGKMNRSLVDAGGSVLAISQFTLYGDARGQRRPSFIEAAPREKGKELYEEFVRALKALGVRVETGVFQTHMSVELVNDGPVTILLDSDKKF